MDTLNNHVVAFGPMVSPSTPRVIALSPGKGELLKVALELGDACQRKRSRPLDVSYVYIDVDYHGGGGDEEEVIAVEPGAEEKLGKNGEKLQKDASHIGYGEGYAMGGDDEGKLYLNVDKGDGGDEDKAKEEDKGGVHMEVDLGQIPSSEAQQQHVLAGQPLTPLEIGMYVLLGVFCVAIVVFMINCMVFVVKYRRKRLPHEGGGRRDPVANANDWVWIGRATLERNAINTGCQHPLMPDSDFNGNNTMSTAQRLLSAPDHPNSNRSSAALSDNSHGLSTLSRAASNARSSMVSTYKGSECSIRITSNPLPNQLLAAAASVPEAPPSPQPGPSCASSLPRHRLSAPLLGTGTIPRIQPPKALPLRASLPTPEQQALLAQAAQAHAAAERCARELDAANGNLTDGGGGGSVAGSLTDVEWDYEAMGLTYEQLMEYFDNLKESTA
jgi:transmembrane protein 132